MRFFLVHGVPSSGALWSGVRRFVPGESVAPDLPGFGGSADVFVGGGNRSGIFEAHVAWLERRVEVGDHLVGHDYGGLLAAVVASRKRVASLTLISTGLGPGWWPAKLAALPVAERICYRTFGGRRWLSRGVATEVGREFVVTHEQWLETRMSIRMRDVARGMPWSGDEVRRRLVAGCVPIRCVWARDDRAFPPWMGRRLAHSLGASFSTAPGGHYGVVDYPEAWAAALMPSAEIPALSN